MQSIRDIKLIRLSDRNRFLAGIAAAALIAGVGGVLIGKSMTDPQAVTEQEAEAEGEEHGPEGFIAMTPERLSASGISSERVVPGSLMATPIDAPTETTRSLPRSRTGWQMRSWSRHARRTAVSSSGTSRNRIMNSSPARC